MCKMAPRYESIESHHHRHTAAGRSNVFDTVLVKIELQILDSSRDELLLLWSDLSAPSNLYKSSQIFHHKNRDLSFKLK